MLSILIACAATAAVVGGIVWAIAAKKIAATEAAAETIGAQTQGGRLRIPRMAAAPTREFLAVTNDRFAGFVKTDYQQALE